MTVNQINTSRKADLSSVYTSIFPPYVAIALLYIITQTLQLTSQQCIWRGAVMH